MIFKQTRKMFGQRFLFPASIVFAGMLLVSVLQATAPYGDPNQPYDKLPGTLETYHVPWASPLPGGKLKVLFIVPYKDSREVVELRQRLDLDYTVIMNVCRSSWWEGYREGANASPIADGEKVLTKLARERLDPALTYDAIVIGKVSWEIIPPEFREMILLHLRRGTALVYVSPNRATPGWQKETPEATTPDTQFDTLFRQNLVPEITARLTAGLPFDLIPLKPVTTAEEALKLPAAPILEGTFRTPVQRAVTVRVSSEGKGRIVVLDYCDQGLADSLSSGVEYDPVMYDYQYALLSRCVLYGVKGAPAIAATVTCAAPPTALKAPATKPLPAGWEAKTPALVIDRQDLDQAKITVSVQSTETADRPLALKLQVRNRQGAVLDSQDVKASVVAGKTATGELRLPVLPRGNYFADVRVCEPAGDVLAFASTCFRVESAVQVSQVQTDKPHYERGQTIQGRVGFTAPLAAGQQAEVQAMDTWKRMVFKTPVTLAADRLSGTFAIPVGVPLCRLWDVLVVIQDVKGRAIDTGRTWVGLPDWQFDDFLMPLIFSAGPLPSDGWRGYLYTDQVRKYGVNGNNVYMVYGFSHQYEYYERAHLISLTYGMHYGENGLGTGTQYFSQENRKQEYDGVSTAELVVMMKDALAGNGKVDTSKFPEAMEFGAFRLGGDYINSQIASHQEVTKFGTPYAFLTGENYLLGEGQGKELSGFSPASTALFQAWSRQGYKNDLAALNTEWGTDFKTFDDVRGILFMDAWKAKQMPRWVAFRYFMRAHVWSEFFLTFSDLMRKNLGAEQLRTGTNGHDHHDFSRYRDGMTSGKLYVGQEANSEYHTAVAEELHQSFSGDNSYLLCAQSMMMLNFDQKNPLNNVRWPWKALFAGYRGFDWEAGAAGSASLGGMSCMTPDFSEPMPFFKNIGEQVLYLERGIGKLCITSKPLRSPVAMLWSLPNHYISRLYPKQDQGFTGTWLYNIAVDGGAIGDCVVLMKNLRLRATFIAPEDLVAGALAKQGFKALILPYNKGMSDDEAKAIRAFAEAGGLVIAENTPGIYTRFGRKRDRSVLADLFPDFSKENIVKCGKGAAAYVPGAINGYLARMERCDYAGSDSIALLLEKYAGITPAVELTDELGKPRRDTQMPVYLNGSSRFVGMIRVDTSADQEKEGTTAKLDKKYHVWNVREADYLGFTDRFNLKLDMLPKFFALLPANPKSMKIALDRNTVRQGDILAVTATVKFADGAADDIDKMGQVVHLSVLDPDGKELEWFRNNTVFQGRSVKLAVPVSFTEKPGPYTVVVDYPITGLKQTAEFKVK